MYTTLAHHGILGQKWGVRRFQNANGSLTKEGKERYSEKKPLFESPQMKKMRQNNASKEEYETYAKKNAALATANLGAAVVNKIISKYYDDEADQKLFRFTREVSIAASFLVAHEAIQAKMRSTKVDDLEKTESEDNKEEN